MSASCSGSWRKHSADVSQLQCGCHLPGFFAATETTPPAGAQWSALHHNCSGKHAGFLAYCRMHGHPFATYLDPGHPLQQRIRTTVARFGNGDGLAWGIDGCSAPNCAMPLKRLAQTYARLAAGDSPELRALFFAMTRHPELVSGTRRMDLAIMQTGDGDWVSKAGADGMQAIGVQSKGLGIAIRIADGNPRALARGDRRRARAARRARRSRAARRSRRTTARRSATTAASRPAAWCRCSSCAASSAPPSAEHARPRAANASPRPAASARTSGPPGPRIRSSRNSATMPLVPSTAAGCDNCSDTSSQSLSGSTSQG